MKQCVNLIFILLNISITAQPAYLKEEVKYLSVMPLIDGRLDSNLFFLQERNFPFVFKSENTNPDIHVNYRLAYGTNFFYMYVEANADSIICRDRAFQNGDGLQLLLAKPNEKQNITDEFYVLACSAVDKPSMEWSRNIFWYYNVDNIFKKTSKDTKFKFIRQNDKISFELVLPWKDVYPYHPWITESIGFNLCFVKAFAKHEKTEYKVINDELGAENRGRKYLFLKFQKPVHEGKPQTYCILRKNSIKNGEKLAVKAVTVASANGREHLSVKIYTGENDLLAYQNITYPYIQGVTSHNFEISEKLIPQGGYKVRWNSLSNSSSGNIYFSVLPEFNHTILNEKIDEIKKNITISSYYTLKYQLLEIKNDLAKLKEYETCAAQRRAIYYLNKNIEDAKKGRDIIAERRGFVRKAYKSNLDDSLIPYMVYIPNDYNENKSYPLFVYLHGSASDEKSLLYIKNLIPKGFIALCPNGRGNSNCYSWDNAQIDISEAIGAVTNCYSIDEENIFLAGFSMGGYGVYRTYYEMPEKFKALAVFSGHPDLANRFSENSKEYPDFLEKKYYKNFKNIPIFIFHGKEDRNCSFELTEQLVDRLKKIKADVKFVYENHKGHELPDNETIEQFFNWVNKHL